MLGTTVPEPNSDGRVFVCSAGVSDELHQLIRIYPLARRSIPNRWHTYRAPLERNPKDSRYESWQIKGNRERGQHEWINARLDEIKPKYAQSARANLLADYLVGSIHEANAKRLSLAILKPDNMEIYCEPNAEAPPEFQLTLFDTNDDNEHGGARSFPLMPRMRFADEIGRHDLMIRDWGVFELQRKRGSEYFRENLTQALHLSNDSSLLVGNMNNRRNNWLVISVLSNLRGPDSLFDAPRHEKVVPAGLRRAAGERDEWKCVKCGNTGTLDLVPADGFIGPVADLELAQVVTKCRDCITGLWHT